MSDKIIEKYGILCRHNDPNIMQLAYAMQQSIAGISGDKTDVVIPAPIFVLLADQVIRNLHSWFPHFKSEYLQNTIQTQVEEIENLKDLVHALEKNNGKLTEIAQQMFINLKPEYAEKVKADLAELNNPKTPHAVGDIVDNLMDTFFPSNILDEPSES